MITMTPVLERWVVVDCPFWDAPQNEYLLPVPRDPTPQQVGAVMWALIGSTVTGDDLSVAPATAAHAIETYLTTREGCFAPGGLRVTHGEVVVDPGCCVGLDEWRDWQAALAGDELFLGHDPDVLLEHRGSLIRLWRDKGQLLPGELPTPEAEYIDIPRAVLAGLLRDVRQDLAGFHAALRPWVRAIAPDLAEELALAVDQCLQISAPLDPCGSPL